jgi:hypothetical protein
MSDQLQDLKLGVGVASLRQDEYLPRTLEAIDTMLTEAGVVPVARVVVSAEGSSAAERLAAQRGWAWRRVLPGSPSTLAAAREAARRGAGGSVTLLVDGDVAVAAGWLEAAVTRLGQEERLAGVGGAVDESHWQSGALVGGRRDVYRAGAGRGATALFDVAVWRRDYLDAVGGFDGWLSSDDEVELGGRLALAGHGQHMLGKVAGVRHGPGRESFAEFRDRITSGRIQGPGVALRRSRGTMLFGRLLARHKGGLLLVAWVLLGIALGIFARDQGGPSIWFWATLGLLVFFAILKLSLPRAFWGGLIALAEGVSVARVLVLPFGLPRLGAAPRPLPPPKEGAAEAAEADARAAEQRTREFEARESASLRDPGEPPPIVER